MLSISLEHHAFFSGLLSPLFWIVGLIVGWFLFRGLAKAFLGVVVLVLATVAVSVLSVMWMQYVLGDDSNEMADVFYGGVHLMSGIGCFVASVLCAMGGSVLRRLISASATKKVGM